MDTVAEREVARDRLKLGDYIGESIIIVLTALVALFFVDNQMQETGFFTSDFGAVEMALFYGSLLYGMVPPVLRMIGGRRNAVRPFEVLGNVIFIVAAVYLLYVFPFDMSHLTDLFPSSLKFILDWMTDDIAKLLFAFAAIVSMLAAVWTAFLYVVVRRRLARAPPA
jgi:hypothetical protein